MIVDEARMLISLASDCLLTSIVQKIKTIHIFRYGLYSQCLKPTRQQRFYSNNADSHQSNSTISVGQLFLWGNGQIFNCQVIISSQFVARLMLKKNRKEMRFNLDNIIKQIPTCFHSSLTSLHSTYNTLTDIPYFCLQDLALGKCI